MIFTLVLLFTKKSTLSTNMVTDVWLKKLDVVCREIDGLGLRKKIFPAMKIL